jgi:hypothetical protein
MGFHDIARLGTFLGALVNALVAVLGSPDRPPRHPVLLCLDEMANLGTLPELEKGVSYLQGSGTRLLAVFQNLPQVLTSYGPHTPLLASISTQVHYRPHDVTTADHIAAHLGQTTTIARSWGTQYGLLAALATRTEAERERPLLTPDEVLRLGDQAAVVLTAGTAPILARKLGTPPPTALAVVQQTVVQHRVGAAISVACALVALALIPALQPVVQTPPLPRPQVAQTGVVPTPLRTAPLPPQPAPTEAAATATSPSAEASSDPTQTEALPSLLRKGQAGEHETPPLAHGDRPWRLMTTNSQLWGGSRPTTQGRYTDEHTCQLALDHPWRQLAKQWAHEQQLGQKGVVVWERDGRVHWERLAGGQQVMNEAWCEKD